MNAMNQKNVKKCRGQGDAIIEKTKRESYE
jgi:hypothetical protein